MSIAAPKGYKGFQFPTRGGQSADIYKQLASGLGGGLPDVLQQLLGQARGDSASFAPQEQQAMNFYNQQLAPGIAQRYAGSGIGSSSGMQNSLAGAAGNLTTNLQSQRNDLMQQSMRNVLGLGEMLLARPDVETAFMKKQPNSFWNRMLGIGLPVAGGVAGGIFGGPMGAAAGAGLGGSLASGFNGGQQGPMDWSGISSLPTKWGT